MKGKKGLSAYLVIAMLISSMAMLFPSVSADPGPWIEVDPALTKYEDANYCDSLGTVFTITVKVYEVTNLYGFDLFLDYNGSHLENTANSVTGTGQVVPTDVSQYSYADNSVNGTVKLAVAFLEALGAPAFSGNGTLAWITFKIIACPSQLTGMDHWINFTLDIDESNTALYNQLAMTIDLDSMDDGEFKHKTAGIIPGAPTASFTWNPTFPKVCDIITLTDTSDPGPSPAVIVSWLWTIVGPADGIGPLDEPNTYFHCSGPGTVTVTLTVTNSFALSDTATEYIEQREVVGCELDLYTGTNRFCGQTTPYVGKGLGENCDASSPGVNMTYYVNVTYNGKPVMHVHVGFEIRLEYRELQQYPERIYELVNETILVRSAETDKDGIAQIWARIPDPCNPEQSIVGKWYVIAKAKIQDTVQADEMRFDVGDVISLHEVWPLKEVEEIWQRWETFQAPCDWMGFEIELKNIMWIEKELVLVIVVYDDCDVPVGQVKVSKIVQGGEWCNPHYETVQILNAIHLPQWTYVGIGKVYVSAFTRLPSDCGLPYCPEISKEFALEWSGLV